LRLRKFCKIVDFGHGQSFGEAQEAKTEGEGELAVSKSEGQGSAGATGERIRFIDHQGKKILLVDFSNCSASEVERISRTVPDYVTVQPRGSVLILTDFSEASFDRET
jgi:hypothetical protein